VHLFHLLAGTYFETERETCCFRVRSAFVKTDAAWAESLATVYGAGQVKAQNIGVQNLLQRSRTTPFVWGGGAIQVILVMLGQKPSKRLNLSLLSR
jgi:hypothetical protein